MREDIDRIKNSSSKQRSKSTEFSQTSAKGIFLWLLRRAMREDRLSPDSSKLIMLGIDKSLGSPSEAAVSNVTGVLPSEAAA